MNRAPKGMCNKGKKIWYEIVKNWELTPESLYVLSAGCEAYCRYMEAQQILNEQGLTFKVGNMIKKHPCISVELTNRAQFLQAMKNLNLQQETWNSAMDSLLREG